MAKIRLYGAWELQQLFGVSRARAYQIANRKGFPDPVGVLRMGSVWDAEEVDAWHAENRPGVAEDQETD